MFIPEVVVLVLGEGCVLLLYRSMVALLFHYVIEPSTYVPLFLFRDC